MELELERKKDSKLHALNKMSKTKWLHTVQISKQLYLLPFS